MRDRRKAVLWLLAAAIVLAALLIAGVDLVLADGYVSPILRAIVEGAAIVVIGIFDLRSRRWQVRRPNLSTFKKIMLSAVRITLLLIAVYFLGALIETLVDTSSGPLI